MTRLRIASDLHTEFIKAIVTDEVLDSMIPYNDMDKHTILVLAGDIVSDINQWRNTLSYNYVTRWFNELSKRFQHIVYVLGNHEGYFSSVAESFDWAYEQPHQFDNFHVLNNQSIELEGIRFLGTTLWTDLSTPLSEVYARKMNDIHLIKDWTVAKWQYAHNVAVRFLMTELEQEFDGKTVVVTHHLPTYMSVKRYRGDPMGVCYASNLDNLIAYNDIALWVHGHAHENFDYMAGDTRIICNPYGYWDDTPNYDYIPTLSVYL